MSGDLCTSHEQIINMRFFSLRIVSLLVLFVFIVPTCHSKTERILPTTSVFFNPGEYWIEGGERGNNLKYEEFVKCVDDLAAATNEYATVMNQQAYLDFLYLQTSGKISEASFQNLLPELSMAYWNLVCVIVGNSCDTDSTVTLKEIEMYALDDGGWLIYQLCSRVDVYIEDALLTSAPSITPTRLPTASPSMKPTLSKSPSYFPSPSPTITPTDIPTVVPSSAPSTKEVSFNFAFKIKTLLPCSQEAIPLLLETKVKEILKCNPRGSCAGGLYLDYFRANTFDYRKYIHDVSFCYCSKLMIVVVFEILCYS